MSEPRDGTPGMGFLGVATVVFRIALAVGVLALIGDGFDRLFHTTPWFLVAGIVIGLALVFADMERKAGSYRRRARRPARDRSSFGERDGDERESS
jgi:F0F1-type ATP synthase assembly protein I